MCAAADIPGISDNPELVCVCQDIKFGARGGHDTLTIIGDFSKEKSAALAWLAGHPIGTQIHVELKLHEP
jgi:hypothetical protein